MNKKIILSLLPIILISGCNSNNGYKKPKDTNLEFWITEKVSSKDMEDKGCTYLPGWFGAEEYLDSRYVAVNKDGMLIAPDIHVTYLLTGYPDLMDDIAVTTIDITDPTITVYGLTINSSEREITNKLINKATKYSYVTTVDECYLAFEINHCWFHFKSNSIVINAPTTNNSGIIY